MAKTLIKSLTASSSASLAFVDGTSDVVMDNTYSVYEFHFVNMHPQTDNSEFTFQVNAADASGFNENMTTTAFYAYNRNTAGASNLTYDANVDQAQEAGYQWILAYDVANDTEGSVSGILT